MKTAEDVVHDLFTTYAHIDRMSGETITAESLYFLAARAIEADRAQHDLQYAREVINRHGGRAVIWSREDLESTLDGRIENEDAELPATQEDYDAIIARAMQSYYWRALDDCSEGDWERVNLALDEALGMEV